MPIPPKVTLVPPKNRPDPDLGSEETQWKIRPFERTEGGCINATIANSAFSARGSWDCGNIALVLVQARESRKCPG